MDVTKLRIDPKSLGEGLIACGVKPVYQYENGHRVSDEVIATSYEIVCPQIGFEKVNVKIDAAAKKIEIDDSNPLEVSFDGLQLSLGWTPNGYIVRATATGIKVIGKVN